MAAAGDGDVLRRLLSQGVSPDARDDNGVPAVHVATSANHAENLGLLLQARADPNTACHCDGSTALMAAADEGFVRCLTALLAWSHAGVDVTDKAGNAALHLCSAHGDLRCVRLLLDAGADRSKRDEDGKTALRKAQEGGHAEVAGLLSGSDVADARAQLQPLLRQACKVRPLGCAKSDSL